MYSIHDLQIPTLHIITLIYKHGLVRKRNRYKIYLRARHASLVMPVMHHWFYLLWLNRAETCTRRFCCRCRDPKFDRA